MKTAEILNRISILEAQVDYQKSILTLEEASKFIGLSKSHLYKLTSTKQIPHYKPHGKLIYFLKNELEKWILKNRIAPLDEL